MAVNQLFYTVSSFAIGLDAILKWFLTVFGIVRSDSNGIVSFWMTLVLLWRAWWWWLTLPSHHTDKNIQTSFFLNQMLFSLIPYPLKILSVVRCNVVSFTNLVLCKNYSLVNSKRMYAKAESVPQRNNNLHNSQSSQFWLETILHSWFLSVNCYY